MISVKMFILYTAEATVLGGLWAVEWAWYIAETNLRCVRSSGICMPSLNSLALIVSEISTDGQTDMARSTRLLILIKNIYVYFMGSETLSSACYILSDESSIPFYSTSNGYKK